MRYTERYFGPVILVLFIFVVTTGLTARLSHGVEVFGAGASFPAPIYTRWIALYERQNPDVVIEYASIGSGGGIEAITDRDVHFGASDALLTQGERVLLPAPLLEIPMVMGPVVIAYNLPRLDDRLTLDADTIAAIYLGDITQWTDDAIADLNPDVDLPDMPIRVTHRSDSSGTTAIFTDYLSAVSETWRDGYGVSKQLSWPISSGAGDGNDGVAQLILLQPGGVGYLEFSYAENAGLEYAALINRDGERVLPTVEGVQAAERNTPPTEDRITKPSIVNAPGAESYPIAGFTYLLVYEDLTYFDEPDAAHALIDYIEWTLTNGQALATDMNYTPLPQDLREAAFDLVETIQLPEREHNEEGDHEEDSETEA